MPRNGSGSYTLPEAPFVPQTPISSSAVNSDFSDIATALTNSLARNGEGGMTAVLPLANTGFTYISDPNTGMYRTASDEQAIKCGGVDIVEFTSTTMNITGTLQIGGVAAFPLATANIANNAVTFAKFQEVAASKLVGNPTGGATEVSEIGISGGLEFSGTDLKGVSVAPTIQRFTSGSGTYTTPAGVKWIRIRMVGGGSGGGGGNNSSGATGGGNTTFSTLTASGGAAGASAVSGAVAGGAASGGNVANIPGGSGTGATGTLNCPGSPGGSSAFGGNGAGGKTAAGNATDAATNSGSGGGGGGGSGAGFGATGGAAGGYVEHIISSPAASYSYAVGAGGAGVAGTSAGNGGAGAAGLIIVEEYY